MRPIFTLSRLLAKCAITEERVGYILSTIHSEVCELLKQALPEDKHEDLEYYTNLTVLASAALESRHGEIKARFFLACNTFRSLMMSAGKDHTAVYLIVRHGNAKPANDIPPGYIELRIPGPRANRAITAHLGRRLGKSVDVHKLMRTITEIVKAKEKVINSKVVVLDVVTPEYIICDPCYIVSHNDEGEDEVDAKLIKHTWEEMLDRQRYYCAGVQDWITNTGAPCAMWHTTYGDGCYELLDGSTFAGELGVDAGMLSICPTNATVTCKNAWNCGVHIYPKIGTQIKVYAEVERDKKTVTIEYVAAKSGKARKLTVEC